MYLRDLKTNTLVDAEIVKARIKDMPLKKDGWNFNWTSAFKETNTSTFILRLKSNSTIQGILQLKEIRGMLVMDLLELAPHNIGQENKRYDYVAGCLIAFACRETFKLATNYKGFLSFESKTKLIDWYINNYYAEIAVGQKMYIAPENGIKLIEEYLNRKNKSNDEK